MSLLNQSLGVDPWVPRFKSVLLRGYKKRYRDVQRRENSFTIFSFDKDTLTFIPHPLLLVFLGHKEKRPINSLQVNLH